MAGWLGNIFGGTGASVGGSEFVGQYVDLGKQKLRIKKVIAEGGYGFVFIAQDSTSTKEYALKRLMSIDEASSKDIVKEISFLRKLRGHPNIIQYIAAASGAEKQAHGMKEYLILTELCTDQLLHFLNSQNPITYNCCLQIFAQTCRAVAHMHKQTPPIIHRDLKIENLLISSKGVIKLCDFGSSTTEALYPDESWSALQRSMAEDEIQRNTTPMYRAPEMIDLYSNNAVTVKADVWAMGCILYVLCYTRHPFEDSAKLKIMNANYTIPEFDQTYKSVHHLICSMLQVNPVTRPSVEDVHAELVALALDKDFDLKAPIHEQRSPTTPEQETMVAPQQGALAANSSALIGNVVNRAGSLFSNIKDVSTKMMSSVAGYVRQDLDISYITSRVLVMSFPADGIEGTLKNNIEDVRVYLESKHPDSFVIINISQRSYRTVKLNDRVYEAGWNPKRAPPLDKLVSLCRKLNNFLKQNKKNVVVVHCLDGRVASSLLISSFFLFCKLFTKLSMSEDLFNLKRVPVGQKTELSPSQKRYACYVSRLVGTPRYMPHKNIVFLKSFTMSAVPVFNKARTGCRPFVEIYEGDKRILTTAQEVEQMREYTVSDGKIVFNTHVRICGDITIHVHHGRSTLGGKVHGKMTSINILSLQFHTGFLEKENVNVKFIGSQLDIQESLDKFPQHFGVTLNVKFTDETPDNTFTEPWEKMHVEKLTPYACFHTKEEYWKLYEEFGLSEEKIPLSKKVSSSSSVTSDSDSMSSPAPTKTGRSTFFNEIEWQAENPPTQNGNTTTAFQPIVTSTQEIPGSTKPGDDGFSSLIDIGTPGSPGIKATEAGPFGDFSQNMNVIDEPATQENLIDPFASLATNRADPSPQGSTNDILLNFGMEDETSSIGDTSRSPFQVGPDLISSNNVSDTTRRESPDILANSNTTPSKKNLSLDDLNNDDFFAKLSDSSNTTTTTTTTNSYQPKQPTDPFMKHFHDVPKKSSSESNLLEANDSFHNMETLMPETQPLHHASSSGSVAENNKKTSYDPFADFGNFGATVNTTTTFGGNHQQPVAQGRSNSARASPTFNNTTHHPQQQQQQQSRQQAPNYNVFVSNAATKPQQSGTGGGAGGGWAPKQMKSDDFSDILNAQGFKSTTSTAGSQKNTLKALRDENKVELDPIKKKVQDWSDGKEHNIRALLTSLETVLWEGENKWKGCKMHEVLKSNQVKKFYRKACLAIYPDKHIGEPHEDLARAIFIELNDAWTLFESSGALDLY